nr:hypothetical protein OG999_43875 [Streptomyces sp. NBC_00886]
MATAGEAWWTNAGGYVPDVLNALAEHPGKVVLRYPGTELTATPRRPAWPACGA